MICKASSFETASARARISTSFWSAFTATRALASFRRLRQSCLREYCAMRLWETP